MSLIDQALKKTQTSLRQNRPDKAEKQDTSPRSPIYSTTHTSQIPLSAQRIINPFKKKYPSNKKYWIVGAVSLIAVGIMGFEIVTHFSPIEKRYAHFYGNIFSHSFVLKKAVPVVVEKPMILNGTMEMDNERVALINSDLYHIGQSVDGYKIKQIRYNNVLLQNTTTHQNRLLTPTLTQ